MVWVCHNSKHMLDRNTHKYYYDEIHLQQSVPLATNPKPLSSKIPFGLLRVHVHFNVH